MCKSKDQLFFFFPTRMYMTQRSRIKLIARMAQFLKYISGRI